MGNTRTEKDFEEHINKTIETDSQAQWIFICDQLKTDKSESLVKLVARLCLLKDELGKKGESGIVKSMSSRASF